MANDLFADAIEVLIAADGATYTSSGVSNVGYGIEPGEPNPVSRYRSAWWKYTPLVSGTAMLDTQLTTSTSDTDTYLIVYSGSALSDLVLVAQDDDAGGAATSLISNLAVTAGVTYYIQVMSFYNTDQTYVLRVTGPATAVPEGVVPPADTEMSVPAPVLAPVVTAIPPAETEVGSTGIVLAVVIPPVQVGAWAGTTSVIRVAQTLTSPAAGAVIPALRPTFVVTVKRREGRVTQPIIVDVQYGTDPTFAAATTLTATVDSTLNTERTKLTPTEDLPQGVPVYWRARLTVEGQPANWIAANTFTIDLAAGSATVPVIWNVTTDDPWMHVWSVDPVSGAVGTEVTIVGQGLPPAGSGSVTLGGLPMLIESWQHIDTSAAGHTAGRQINADRLDADHDEIVAIVPDGAPTPGGLLRVEGS